MNIELLEGEVWKDIPIVDNRYQISNYARLYSKKHKRLLKTGRDAARIYLDGKKIDIPILKLMRELFPDEQDLSKFAKIKSLEGESWLPVQGFEEYYHISNMGRLKILDRLCWKNATDKLHTRIKKERISAMIPNDKGYPSHILVKDDIKHTQTIHRLVALHFIPNPENKPQVNHKNGIKWDNRVENLEWVTESENSIHAYETGLSKAVSGESHYQAKITDEKAREIKYQLSVKNDRTLQEIADICGVGRSIVKDISQNSTWKHIKI